MSIPKFDTIFSRVVACAIVVLLMLCISAWLSAAGLPQGETMYGGTHTLKPSEHKTLVTYDRRHPLTIVRNLRVEKNDHPEIASVIATVYNGDDAVIAYAQQPGRTHVTIAYELLNTGGDQKTHPYNTVTVGFDVVVTGQASTATSSPSLQPTEKSNGSAPSSTVNPKESSGSADSSKRKQAGLAGAVSEESGTATNSAGEKSRNGETSTVN